MSQLLSDTGTELTMAYLSTGGTLQTKNTDITNEYTLNTASGALTITSLSNATTGTYFCRTQSGYSQTTVTLNPEPTTTTSSTLSSSALPEVSVYYIVLGSILLAVVIIFIGCYWYQKKRPKDFLYVVHSNRVSPVSPSVENYKTT